MNASNLAEVAYRLKLLSPSSRREFVAGCTLRAHTASSSSVASVWISLAEMARAPNSDSTARFRAAVEALTPQQRSAFFLRVGDTCRWYSAHRAAAEVAAVWSALAKLAEAGRKAGSTPKP